MKVFVYGTLKQGLWNHGILQDNFDKVENGEVSNFELTYWNGDSPSDEDKTMYNSNLGIPVMIKSEHEKVLGEVFTLKEEGLEYTVNRLDGLEGVDPDTLNGGCYNRRKVQVHIPETGKTEEVWAYIGDR